MSSNKHGEYRRPELTRVNDLLAQDQRRILEDQKKRLERQEKVSRSILIGTIKSKYYSNANFNANYCYNLCTKKHSAPLNSPLSKVKETEIKADEECLAKCMLKKGESFNMLIDVIIYLI